MPYHTTPYHATSCHTNRRRDNADTAGVRRLNAVEMNGSESSTFLSDRKLRIYKSGGISNLITVENGKNIIQMRSFKGCLLNAPCFVGGEIEMAMH